MARGVVAATASKRAGQLLPAETAGDPANDHYYNNSGKTLLLVRNASADTAYDVTVITQSTVDSQAVGDRVVEIPFGETWVFGPYDVSTYGSQVQVDVEHADLKLRCIEPGVS